MESTQVSECKPMPSVLITGANRGLGLEFATQYLSADWQGYATRRPPETAGAVHGPRGCTRQEAHGRSTGCGTAQAPSAIPANERERSTTPTGRRCSMSPPWDRCA